MEISSKTSQSESRLPNRFRSLFFFSVLSLYLVDPSSKLLCGIYFFPDHHVCASSLLTLQFSEPFPLAKKNASLIVSQFRWFNFFVTFLSFTMTSQFLVYGFSKSLFFWNPGKLISYRKLFQNVHTNTFFPRPTATNWDKTEEHSNKTALFR